ncbi:MAG: DUF4446 family protein [Candidatus Pacebacteria bacterium]|nr:DUF4446 family protein [Candidatus Paceibacterota bacterium]
MFPFKGKKKKPEIKNFSQAEKYIGYLEEKIEQLEEEFKKEKNKNRMAFKKAGLIRYNPFREKGGDQSFSLALLDEEDKGFVLTSIYTHEGVRIFAKPVTKGESQYQLSDEEREAIRKAKEAYGRK